MTAPAHVVPEFVPEFPDNPDLLARMYQWHEAHRNAPVRLIPADRRRFNLGCVRIKHPQWDAVIAAGDDLVTEPSNDVRCLMLEGPPRVGKTSTTYELAMRACARAWPEGLDTYPGMDGVTRRIVPVLFVKAAYSEAKDLMRDLLRGLGYRNPRGTANDMLNDFVERCRLHWVRIIVVDDLHNSGDRVTTLPNFYKRLIDRLASVTFIFTAVDFTQSPLRRPEDCPSRSPLRPIMGQLWERATAFTFTAVDPADPKQIFMFWEALSAQAAMLRLSRQDQFDLLQPAVALQLLTVNHFKLAGALAHVARAAAQAVGTTEGVGHQELGLSLPRRGRPTQVAS